MIASSIVLEVSQNITVSLSEPLLSSGRNWVRKRAHEQREHITPRIHDYSLKPPLRRKEQRGMRINHPPFTTFSLFVWCHKQPLMLSTISRISTNLWCMSNKATLMVDINLESIAFWQRVFSCVELGCCPASSKLAVPYSSWKKVYWCIQRASSLRRTCCCCYWWPHSPELPTNSKWSTIIITTITTSQKKNK